MNKNYSAEDLITTVTGVGPATAEKLNRLAITTVGDLLRHYPVRFIDFTKRVPIAELKNKQEASFIATIDHLKTFLTGSKKLLTQATARDKTGTIKLTWFNNPYIKRLIKEGEIYSVAGKPSFFGPGLTLISPVIEEGSSFSINTTGLVPIFPQTAGLTSRFLRHKIFTLLSQTTIEDPVEKDLLHKNHLPSLAEAYFKIHFPKTTSERWQADKRLAYDEHLRINIQNKLELAKLGS